MEVLDSKGGKHQVPDYMWIPPATHSVFKAQTQADVGRTPPTATGNAVTFSVAPEANPGDDPNPRNGQPCSKIPHPLSDFSHIDPADPVATLIGPSALEKTPGHLRLRFLYDFLLKELVNILDKLSKAPASAYSIERDKYIAFLEDLDDHEPENGRGVRPGFQGYGKAIKWFDLVPQITNNAARSDAKVTGVFLVIKWNPHSSSSTVKVP